jgi:hypothetical protein
MTRFINIILIIITLAGVGMLLRQRSAHSTVRSEFDRLSKQYGVLDVADPDKYYVNYVESEDPYCFRWRVYVPPINNMIEALSTKSGDQSSSTGGGGGFESVEYLHLCRIRFEPKCLVYVRGRFGTSTSSVSDEKVARFVEDHWEDLDVDILGAKGPVEIDRDKPVRLISILIPDDLQGELLELIGEESPNAKNPKWKERPVLEVVFGSEQAFLNRGN